MQADTNVKIAPRRLGHLNVFVTDMEASGRFYSDVCGFQEVFREPGISMIFMSNGNTHHDLGLMEITKAQRIGRDGHVQVATGQGRTPGLNHLGFEMETEAHLVEAYRRAKTNHIPISRTTDHQIAHSIYLSDINGHTLEFYADSVDDWREVYAQNVGKLITGHWDPDAGEPSREPKGVFERELYRSPKSALASQNVAYAGLPVKDFEKSLAYYVDVIGLRAISIDRDAKFAVLSGTADHGCDLCLVGTTDFFPARLLFGGIQLHNGQPIDRALAVLRERGVPAAKVGGTSAEAVVVIDPDGIPLVYSTAPARELMSEHGPRIVDEVTRLLAVSHKHLV
jgi:catechol 2,3-dioxygenase